MLLLEHDGKDLLARHGAPVPRGTLVLAADEVVGAMLPPGPWMVKAQVGAGGRGKAGGVRGARSVAEVGAIVAELSGAMLGRRRIQGFRVEERLSFLGEAYVGFFVDPGNAGVRVLLSDKGGVEVETADRAGEVVSGVAEPSLESIAKVVEDLSSSLPEPVRDAIRAAGLVLASAFVAEEATLLEVNPVFLMEGGSWVAGDAKVALDLDTSSRRSTIRDLLDRRPGTYPEAELKLRHGFDYVTVDPDGEIGLITTGAGLSMQLIDEMRRSGDRPFNFCDLRSGLLRGDPQRIVDVMRWIAAGPEVRAVLVNIFAGVTDLGEFARLLVAAARAVPELKAPMVARLIGNNFDQAREILLESGLAVEVEPDLDAALAALRAKLARPRQDTDRC